MSGKRDQISAFVDRFERIELSGFNPEAKRVVATVRRKNDGVLFYIAKGLPSKVLNTKDGSADSSNLQ